MNQLIPKSKAQEAIEKLNKYLDLDDVPDDLTLKRLKRDLNSTKIADPLHAYTALGMIAVLEWDVALVDEYHQAAVRSMGDEITHGNYATLFARICNPSKAAAEACLASELAPTDLDALDTAIDYSRMAGKYNCAKQLCDMYNSRSPRLAYANTNGIAEVSKILQQNGTSEAHAEKCNDVAFTFLRERKIRCSGVRFEANHWDCIVFCNILLNLPNEQICALDDELASRLFEAIPEFLPSAYWIGFEAGVLNEH